MNVVVDRLVSSYATLIMANKRTLEEVPELYTIGGVAYELRNLVDIEVAERTIELITAA